METSQAQNKFDEKIIEALRNYSTNVSSGDWDRMERMLDVTPKSTIQFGSYYKAIIIGATALIVLFLTFMAINFSNTSTEPTVTETPAVEEIITPVTKPAPSPAPAPASAPITLDSVQPVSPVVIEKPIVTPAIQPVKPEVKTTTPVDKTAEQTKKEKKQPTLSTEPAVPKEQKAKADTSKTTASKPKETKKSTGKVGLSGLLNLNVDSMKKQQEKTKTDTLK